MRREISLTPDRLHDLEPLQSSLNDYVHALRTGPTKVALLHWSTGHIDEGIFGRNDYLVLAPSLLHPFPDLLLALIDLIYVGGIDEIASEAVQCVQGLKRSLLVAFAHHSFPVDARQYS